MSAAATSVNREHVRDDTIWCRRRCACCRLTFSFETSAAQVEVRERCEPCEAHYEVEGEPVERALARARDHEARLRSWADEEVRAACRAGQEVLAARDRARYAECRRDQWRELAARMLAEHDAQGRDGACRCGQPAPCPTVRAARSSSRSMLRELATGPGSASPPGTPR